MKLIYCPLCNDILVLRAAKLARTCHCGESGGKYDPNGQTAEIYGDAIALGIDNTSFAYAVANRPKEGRGLPFAAWVMPTIVPSIRCYPERTPRVAAGRKAKGPKPKGVT